MPQPQRFRVGDRVRTTYRLDGLLPGAVGTIVKVFGLGEVYDARFGDVYDVRFDDSLRPRVTQGAALELISAGEQHTDGAPST